MAWCSRLTQQKGRRLDGSGGAPTQARRARRRLVLGLVGWVVSAVVLGVGLSCVVMDGEYCESRTQCPYADTPLGPMQLFCHSTRHVCVLSGTDVCVKDEDCGVDRPHCNVDTNACTPCHVGDPSDTSCARFKDRPLCGLASDGSGATLCLSCRNNLDCPSATPICDSQQCRKCSEHSDCEGELNCDDGNRCTDSLVCMGAGEVTPERGGSCAQNIGTNRRVVYVNNLDASCATITNPDEPLRALDGTLLGSQLGEPQCTLEQAVKVASSQGRRYIRVFGRNVLPPSTKLMDGGAYSFIGAPRRGASELAHVRSLGGAFLLEAGGTLALDQLDLFEQNKGTVISCTGSRLTVRRCLVRGNAAMNDTGLTKAAIQLNDCTTVLDGNTIGVSKLSDLTDVAATTHWKGISVVGTSSEISYLIQNNLIAGNLSAGLDLQGTEGITHLVSRFNTIVGNGRKVTIGGAVLCALGATGQELSHSILWGNSRSTAENSQIANSAYCGMKDLVVGTDEGLTNPELKHLEPGLDANLHLSAGSSPCCVDKVTPATGETLPSHDRFGTPRPQGASWDIGAEERKP